MILNITDEIESIQMHSLNDSDYIFVRLITISIH